MTACVIQRDEQHCYIGCKGHSGTDDVCTAVSTLLYTLAGWIRNSSKAKEIEIKLNSGDAEIEFICYDYEIIELMEIGFKQLEKTAPDCIKVKVLS